MSDDAGGRPTPPGTPPPERDHRPLRLPELDPLPWTGTAAPGNTGRPYGQAATLVAPPGTGWRPGVPTAVVPGSERTDGVTHADRAARGADPARGAAVPTGGGNGGSTGGSSPAEPHHDRAAVVSADRAGRRALRTALTGVALVFLSMALRAGAPNLAAILILIAFVAGIAAFVRGIGAIRRARRVRVSGARGGFAVAIGAVALCLVVAGLVYVVAHRSDLSRYTTCLENAAGSPTAVRQQCAQQLPDALRQSLDG